MSVSEKLDVFTYYRVSNLCKPADKFQSLAGKIVLYNLVV